MQTEAKLMHVRLHKGGIQAVSPVFWNGRMIMSSVYPWHVDTGEWTNMMQPSATIWNEQIMHKYYKKIDP
jgi:hypothetical protein